MSSAARTTRSTRRLAAKACRGRHALCAGQERGTASDIDAAQDARTAGQAADHVRQRPAWTSDGVRPRRRQGNWTRRRTDRHGGERRGASGNRQIGREDFRGATGGDPGLDRRTRKEAVSYTHLTLPTIYSV